VGVVEEAAVENRRERGLPLNDALASSGSGADGEPAQRAALLGAPVGDVLGSSSALSPARSIQPSC
jgi:hypothetical protein